MGTRKQLVLALSVEEHAESSKERPRKDENASRKYEDEKKREMEMRRGLCVGRVELWERKREKGRRAFEAKARKKLVSRRTRKRLVPEGGQRFLGCKPPREYSASTASRVCAHFGVVPARGASAAVPARYLDYPSQCRGAVACDVTGQTDGFLPSGS